MQKLKNSIPIYSVLGYLDGIFHNIHHSEFIHKCAGIKYMLQADHSFHLMIVSLDNKTIKYNITINKMQPFALAREEKSKKH